MEYTAIDVTQPNENGWVATGSRYEDGSRDMKIAVVGATGATGRRVVKHALAQGHLVTAVARYPERLSSADRLSFVRGDVLSPVGLTGALDGVEAVLAASDQKRTYRRERSCQSVSPAFSPNANVRTSDDS